MINYNFFQEKKGICTQRIAQVKRLQEYYETLAFEKRIF